MADCLRRRARRIRTPRSQKNVLSPSSFEMLEPRLLLTAWVQLIITYAGSTQQRVTRNATSFVLAGGPDGPNPNLTQLDLNSAAAQDPSWIHYFDCYFES